jgi:hypothetical protein
VVYKDNDVSRTDCHRVLSMHLVRLGDDAPGRVQCHEDMDCCQQAGWSDKYLCIGGYCAFLAPGTDAVWHDPIPVCDGDAGVPWRRP